MRYRDALRSAAIGTVSAQALDAYDPLADLPIAIRLEVSAWLDRPRSRFTKDPSEDIPTSEHLILPTHWPAQS